MRRLSDNLGFNIVVVEFPQPSTMSLATATVKYINCGASAFLGYSAEELSGQPLKHIIAPASQAGFSAWLTAPPQDDNDFECRLLGKHGNILPAWLSSSLLSGGLAILLLDSDARRQEFEILEVMHRAIEQSASAVVIADPEACIEYVNPKFIQLTGFAAEELLGHNLRILQSGMTSKEYYQSMWQTLLESGAWRGEIENRKKNGELFWAYESISAIRNRHGEISHFLSIVDDISIRKRAEAALSESEERFRQMAEMTGEWLWEQNPGGFYIYSSVAVKEILGFSPAEIIGKHYTELLTAQDQESLKPNIGIQQPFYLLTNHYRHRDGHRVITESTGVPIKDAAGQLLKWRGVDRDITARKHFEEALIDSEKRKRLIFETAFNAVVIMDSYGLISDWNPHAEKVFGWNRDEALGRPLADLIIPQRFREAHRQGLQRFLKTGQGNILHRLIEHTAMRRDGSEFPVEFSVAPLRLGNVYEFSGFIHDISARKETEKKIRQAQIELAITRNEIKIAQQIQASLLPAEPLLTADYEIAGFCLPADQVGGDYYDYFLRNGEHVDMIVADVSGHAVGPALLMAETRSALRAQAKWPGMPAQTLAALNNFLFEDLNRSDFFITMAYLQYDPASGKLRHANAGHPPPLLLKRDAKQCLKLDAEGLLLGIRKQVVFEEKTVLLEPGDAILLYTDGLTETENHAGEFFGAERVARCFQSFAHLPPQRIIESILQQLRLFSDKDTYNDDITLMLFKCSSRR